MASFSSFALGGLVQVISGDSGMNNSEPPVGLYRSASDIDLLLLACGIRPSSNDLRLPDEEMA